MSSSPRISHFTENRRLAARLAMYALSLEPAMECNRVCFENDRTDYLEELLLISMTGTTRQYADSLGHNSFESGNMFLGHINSDASSRFFNAIEAHPNDYQGECDSTMIDLWQERSVTLSNNTRKANMDFKIRVATAILEADAIREVERSRVGKGAHIHVKLAIVKAILDLPDHVSCVGFHLNVLKEMLEPRPVPYCRLDNPLNLFSAMTETARLNILSIFPNIISNDTDFFSYKELEKYMSICGDEDDAITEVAPDEDFVRENPDAAPNAFPEQEWIDDEDATDLD